MDEQFSCRDLLSDLPLDIIHTILSFVPITEAIGTSLLSRKWRYIWTTLPKLTFDDERLIRIMNQVLLLHKGPIHKFKVRFPSSLLSGVQFQCIHKVLLFLNMNDIRILVLHFNHIDSWLEVPNSLYACQNLTHLELTIHSFPPPPPSFKGFLFLKSLDISTLELDSSTIESIIAHSPLLEELNLFGKQYSEMTIRAPNLKLLQFVYGCTHLSLCTPMLEELIVTFANIKHFSFYESSVFHHLRIIELSRVPFNRAEVRMAVNSLITHSPNLQKLEISTLPARKVDAPHFACVSFEDIEPGFTFHSLKVIKMMLSSCEINEMNLIKFFLARSPVLERMMCILDSSLSEQVLLNLKAELLSCPRASVNAEIVTCESLADHPFYLQILRPAV